MWFSRRESLRILRIVSKGHDPRWITASSVSYRHVLVCLPTVPPLDKIYMYIYTIYIFPYNIHIYIYTCILSRIHVLHGCTVILYWLATALAHMHCSRPLCLMIYSYGSHNGIYVLCWGPYLPAWFMRDSGVNHPWIMSCKDVPLPIAHRIN